MVDTSILTMVYKPTYNWGAQSYQSCNYSSWWFNQTVMAFGNNMFPVKLKKAVQFQLQYF